MQRIRQPLTRASRSSRQLTRPTEPVVLSENRGMFNRYIRGVFYAGKPVLASYTIALNAYKCIQTINNTKHISTYIFHT